MTPRIRKLLIDARDELDEATAGRWPADVPSVKALKRDRARHYVKIARLLQHRELRTRSAPQLSGK